MTEEVKPPVGAVAATEPVKGEAKPQDVTAAPDAGADPAADSPKKPKGVQKRIDELTRDKRNLERTVQQLLQQQGQPAAATPPPPMQPSQGRRPTRDQFPDEDAYIDAVADWRIAANTEKVERQKKEREAIESRQKVASTFAERQEAARQKLEDYDDVALSDDVPITDQMAEAIHFSDVGPELAYYLGKHLDEAKRISEMTQLQAALALGRIEERLEAQKKAEEAPPVTSAPAAPAPKPATKAPPPPKTLSGPAPVQKNPDDMTTTEWMAWRNSQIRKKRA